LNAMDIGAASVDLVGHASQNWLPYNNKCHFLLQHSQLPIHPNPSEISINFNSYINSFAKRSRIFPGLNYTKEPSTER